MTAARHGEEMAQVTLAFMDKLQQRKKDKAVLEFNDLEHYALQSYKENHLGEGSEASSYYQSTI